MRPTSFVRTLRLTTGLILAALSLTACQKPAGDAAPQNAQTQTDAAFLSENGKKAGVTTTASGLQYEVIQEGQGAMPAATDTVTVNYRGILVNGQEFDSGNGISFPLNRVIPGWTEGLQLMKEGARYRFFIPSELAYGERGAGTAIPPNTALIFEVDLIKVGQ